MNNRPRWNVEREQEAEAWAKRVDSEVLAAMLSTPTGTTYWLAAKAEWDHRYACDDQYNREADEVIARRDCGHGAIDGNARCVACGTFCG